jgi:hypothetical protein
LIHHHRKEGNLDEFVPILSTGKIFLQLGKEEEEREEKSGKKEQKHDAQKCLPRTLDRSHPSCSEALARMAGPFQSW